MRCVSCYVLLYDTMFHIIHNWHSHWPYHESEPFLWLRCRNLCTYSGILCRILITGLQVRQMLILFSAKFQGTYEKLIIIPPEQRSCWGVYWFHSVRLSVRPSVRLSVRLSRLPCPLCNIYSSGWILSILATNDLYHERVCRTQWPLTLTYIFKFIRPWLRKSCPLCSVYSSGWIIFIFGTNDHFH